MSEHHNGKCKCRLLQGDLHINGESSLRKKRNSLVCVLPATSVNRCYDRMVCGACFHGRVRFGIAHLAHADYVGIESQSRHNEIFLGNAVLLIVRRTGQGMHHVVNNLTVCISFHKRKLSCTRFDTVNSLVIGNGTQERIEKCGLTRRGSTCHNERNAVTQAHFKE